jgi:hypothetical protein
MRNPATIILVLCSLAITTAGQQFSVRWSDKFKYNNGLRHKNEYIKTISAEEGTVVSIFRVTKSNSYDRDYELLQFDGQPALKGQTELDYPPNGKEGFVDIVKMKGVNYLLEYSYTSKDAIELYATPFNLNSFQQGENRKKIADLDNRDAQTTTPSLGVGGRVYSMYDLTILYSSDSSKLLLYYEPERKKKDRKNMQFVILDQQMQQLKYLQHEWTESFNKVLTTGLSVDNYGRVYLLYNVYEKSVEREFIRSDGEKIPSYTTHLLTFDRSGQSTHSFDSEGKFIHNGNIGYTAEGKIILIGLYKDRYNGRISGVFRSAVPDPGETKIAGIKFTVFPTELLQKIETDDQAKSNGSRPGLDNGFDAGYTVSVSDGVNHMIAENFDVDKGSRFAKGDMLVTTFLPDGKINFQRIPRFEQTVNINASFNLVSANSYRPEYFEDKLLLFYFDAETNLARSLNLPPEKFADERKSALVAAVLSHDGILLSRKLVYTHVGLGGYATDLNFSSIAKNKYIVYARQSAVFKAGALIGILSIK